MLTMPQLNRSPERRGLMKDQPEEKLFSKGEWLAIVLVFSVFLITMLSLVSLDPELVLWGGSMGLGSLYTPDPPPRLFDNPREAFLMASKLCLIGLVALLCLMVIKGEARFGWRSWLKARWIEWRSQQALEGRGRPKIGVDAHSRDVDDRREK
jgi:hypothetical protein